MSRKITLYFEPADGLPDRLTGVHVDHGDGTASWLASGALDGITPPGSPRTLRQIGERLRDDAKPLPKFIPAPAERPAPQPPVNP